MSPERHIANQNQNQNRKPETGNRKPETGNRKPETGITARAETCFLNLKNREFAFNREALN